MENEALKNDANKPDSGSAVPIVGAGAGAAGEDADGCDVAITDSTPDEELPATEGGVA
jgi:hypothetical protein